MSTISVVSTPSTGAVHTDDRSSKSVALFCCIGLVVSLCLMMSGVDLGAGWV
jgi:hypothetical protein